MLAVGLVFVVIVWFLGLMIRSPVIWIIAILASPFIAISAVYDAIVSDVMWESDVWKNVFFTRVVEGNHYNNNSYGAVITVMVVNSHKTRRSPENLWMACKNSRFPGQPDLAYSAMRSLHGQFAKANGSSMIEFNPETSMGNEMYRPGAYACAIGYSHDDAIKASSLRN